MDPPLPPKTIEIPWSRKRVAYAVVSVVGNVLMSLGIMTFVFIPVNLVLHFAGGPEFGPQNYGQFGLVGLRLFPSALAIGMTSGFLWMRNKVVGGLLFVSVALALMWPTIYEFSNWNSASFLSLLIVSAICLVASIATVRVVRNYATEKYAEQCRIDSKLSR